MVYTDRKSVDCTTVAKKTRFRLDRRLGLKRALGLSLAGSLIAASGQAQETAGVGSELEEITVTATRQTASVNRVPLTITAVTQDRLDQQGIKTAVDLTRLVPGLATVGNPGGAQQTFSIRGIVGVIGSATTSVYLDDTNLTKRANGGVQQNNGVVLPVLYDLQRVEVLKGPQGTLYGGSSQGGTVRYITPTPNLTEYSGSTRLELSSIGSDGELSHEFGAAFGGPIVQDKLGFRVSGIRRETGGWVDSVSAYTGSMLREDANSTTEWAGRATLLWQATDRFSAQLSGYHVDNESEGGASTSTQVFTRTPGSTGPSTVAPAGTTFTTQQRCITNITRPTSGLAPYTPTAVPGAPGASPFVPVSAPCAAATPTTLFVRPSRTYGPFRTGQYINLATGRQEIVGQTSEADVVALSLNMDFDGFSAKSITSYLGDNSRSDVPGGEEWSSTTTTTIRTGTPTTTTTGQAGQGTTTDANRGFPLFQDLYDATGGRGYTGTFLSRNKRDGISQEFRLSSSGESRLSWVTGAFYSKADTKINYNYVTPPAIAELIMQLMYGPAFTSQARYGIAQHGDNQTIQDTDITDKELAVFGEGNYWIVPDKLRATVGLRYSKVELDYNQLNYGQFNGRQPFSDGAVTKGISSDKPLTPKVGLQYNFADDRMIYATASKGFRAGGVNSEISQSTCQTALDQLGITAREIPRSYDPDTVWSYELGSKLRLFDTVQLNVAAYRIDWDSVQATTTLSCGQSFTANGGKARSEGGEVQLQFQPIAELGFYLNASYTDAYYIDAVTAPIGAAATAPPPPSFNRGDKFNVAPFQMSAGVQFNFTMGDSLSSFVRLDGTYAGDYNSGATVGSGGWGGNYFLYHKPERQQVNLRGGVLMDNGLGIDLFVQNVFNNEDQIVLGTTGFSDGRGTCDNASPDCSVYRSFNPFVLQAYQEPRKYGVQVNYKF